MNPVKSLQDALPAKFWKSEPSTEEGKMDKSAVLYLHRTGTEYQCKDCVLFQPAVERCWIHSDVAVIKPYGTCGLFVKGKPNRLFERTDQLGAVSKLESGYVEHKEGYSCKRCEYFLSTALDCQKVDKNSPGDDTGKIHPDACCNKWEEK
jgi:hypothetical protein